MMATLCRWPSPCHKAVTTGDPTEALALARQHRPACVITDLKMLKMDVASSTKLRRTAGIFPSS